MSHHKRSSVPSAAAPSWKIKLIGMMTNPIAPAGAGFLIWRVHRTDGGVGVMRENRFRGKRIDNGDWVYGYYRKYRDRHQIGRNIAHEDFYYFKWFDVDPSTVGHLVRQGSEPRFDLYEGDILTDDWGYRYVIEWDNEDTVYRARDIATGELETLHGKWAIGREHDNPELLEVE